MSQEEKVELLLWGLRRSIPMQSTIPRSKMLMGKYLLYKKEKSKPFLGSNRNLHVFRKNLKFP
jgi:hypothetical protein